MSETDAERLRLINTESECASHAEIEYRVIRLQNFKWLIEQAERAQELKGYCEVIEKDKSFFHGRTLVLQDENTLLREALDFYADQENYVHDDYDTSEIDRDSGQRARKALEQSE